MTKIGIRPVFFTGSKKTIKRLVKKDESGKYFVLWYGWRIEVEQVDKHEEVTVGWRTKEKY